MKVIIGEGLRGGQHVIEMVAKISAQAAYTGLVNCMGWVPMHATNYFS